jgi:type IV pilus assembly protein PilA
MFKKNKDKNNGFTLIEVVVSLLITMILMAIAIPIFMNQKNKSYRTVALINGGYAHSEITTLLQDYTSLGTLSPANNQSFASISNGVLTLTFTTGSTTLTGNGAASLTSPLALDKGITISSSGFAPASVSWCLAFSFKGQYVVYTQDGSQTAMVTCNADGTFA